MLTKVLNRSELAEALKADGMLDERPDLALYVLSGASPYTCKDITYVLEGSEAARSRSTRAVPATQAPAAISDEDAERRVDAIFARRAAATAPAAVTAPREASREPAAHAEPTNLERSVEAFRQKFDDEHRKPTRDFLAEVTRRISLTEEQRNDEEVDSVMRRALERSAADDDRRAVIAGHKSEVTSADILEFAMRGVNDVRVNHTPAIRSAPPHVEHVSRNPSGDLVRLATQGLPAIETYVSDFDDGPEAA